MMKGTEQRHELATYTPIITKEMGIIDWRKSAVEIDRQIRAFVFWPTAYTFLDGKMMKIFEAVVEENQRSSEPRTDKGNNQRGYTRRYRQRCFENTRDTDGKQKTDAGL